MVTDRVTFAGLCNVTAVDSWRSRGIASEMVRTLTAHANLRTLRRRSLLTHDAHGVYACIGGITGFPIAIRTLVDPPAAWLPPLLVPLLVAAAVVPAPWLARRLSSRRAVFKLLGAQAAFSFAQVAIRAMMILEKYV